MVKGSFMRLRFAGHERNLPNEITVDMDTRQRPNEPANGLEWPGKTNLMKTLSILVGLLAVLLITGCASVSKAPGVASLSVKTGDEIYVCPCDTCECHVVALKAGKCGCGHDLVKVTVTEVKDQVASYQADGKTKTAKLTAKYMCACGSGCCQMISDEPGKCACGKKLVKAG
jgi:hypothetical protein